MPMFTIEAKTLMLEALDGSLPTGIGMLSLHQAYADTSDSALLSELTGGSPAYARQPANWYPASEGLKVLSSGVTFDVPAGSTVAWVGYWSTEVVPTFLGMAPVGGNLAMPFGVAGSSTAAVQCVAHPLAVGSSVVVWGNVAEPLPVELSEGSQYYVVAVTTDTLELSLTLAGPSITFGSAGSGFLQQFVPSAYPDQDQYTVTIFGIDSRVI